MNFAILHRLRRFFKAMLMNICWNFTKFKDILKALRYIVKNRSIGSYCYMRKKVTSRHIVTHPSTSVSRSVISTPQGLLIKSPGRLADVDAALHTYEDACNPVGCYIEPKDCDDDGKVH